MFRNHLQSMYPSVLDLGKNESADGQVEKEFWGACLDVHFYLAT